MTAESKKNASDGRPARARKTAQPYDGSVPLAPMRRPSVQVLPIIPLKEIVLFPHAIISLALDSPQSIELLDAAIAKDRRVVLLPVRDPRVEAKNTEDFHPVGCVGRIIKTLRLPDDSRRILVRGLDRVRLQTLIATEPFMRGSFGKVQVSYRGTLEIEALAKTAQQHFQNIVSMSPAFPDELKIVVYNIDNYGRLADMIADTLSLSFPEKLAVLSTPSLLKRLELVLGFLNREEVVLRVGGEIQSKVSAEITKNQREHFLREQLKAIQEQLGEEAETPDIVELRERIETADLPEDAKEAALSELKRLRQMHPAAADYNVSRTYVDWILSLPWYKYSTDRLDIKRATQVLEKDHYGLKKIKERILEFLAILQLKQDMKAPILCFVGPPGVGKTSLGQSIAKALDRQFVRLSLGGIRDEAEIRGHRRTYIGALPGRIIQGLKRAKTANPVFMLDEIDKLGTDFRGDPASALLEVLDPQQNTSFSDHYLEIPFDLSAILFITTANLTDPIPPALKDRMEIIRIPGYTQEEKCEIARRFLVPRQLQANGLKRQQLSIYKDALQTIIAGYTQEAGVRNLEREIGTVCRKHARRIVEGSAPRDETQRVTQKEINEYLGPQMVFQDEAIREPQVGVTTGLAWTAAGGEILHIEANTVPGSGKLVLTGSLGEVMKESAQIAFSFVRSQYRQIGFASDMLEKLDVHVHVPSGATPKDGPSAGIAITAAIASLLSGRPVNPLTAMTGEISLQGHVLPVGGIKEKMLAAARAGVRTVLLPNKNRNELLEDIPEEIRNKVHFELISDALPALNLVLAAKAEGKAE